MGLMAKYLFLLWNRIVKLGQASEAFWWEHLLQNYFLTPRVRSSLLPSCWHRLLNRVDLRKSSW